MDSPRRQSQLFRQRMRLYASRNELYKFGSKRCMDVLNCMDGHMLYSLTSKEAIDEVYKRMRLRINFKEAFDRVQEVDE